MTIESQLQKLEPGALVELFKLDAEAQGGDVLYFHRYLQQGVIYWDGYQFEPWPIEVEGFAKTSDQPPTPKLTVANLDGSISEICRLYDDLVGATLTRIRTFGEYLDGENFVNRGLILNGLFAANLDHWTVVGSDISWDAGRLRLDAGAGTIMQEITGLTAGISATVDVGVTTAGLYRLSVGTTPGGFDLLGPLIGWPSDGMDAYFTPTGTTAWLTFEHEPADAGVEPPYLATATTYIESAEVYQMVGNPTADPTQQFPPEIWYIERKANETNEAVEFELVSALDLNGVKLPRRQIIANYCSSMSNGGYRGPYCGYVGAPVAKADGTPTSDPDLDRCGGKLSDCKLRIWPDNVLNFGGFPAAGLVRN